MNVKVILLYIYTFFIIYMPPITDYYFNFRIQYVMTILLLFISIPFILNIIRDINKRNIRSSIFGLYLGLLIATIYITYRALVTDNEIRVLQNLFILVQVTHVLFMIKCFKRLNYKRMDIFRVLLNLSVFQAVVALMMIIFPPFKDIALNLYYLGKEENIFISQMRIYGISGDYTFFTPIYHSILLLLCSVLALLNNFKYFYYVPFLLIIILLNGRFGIIIITVILIYLLVYLLFKGKLPKNLFKYAVIISFIIVISLVSISIFLPQTYSWIIDGFEDTLLFFQAGEVRGNYNVLMDDYLFFPEGISIIFGEGIRVFGETAILNGYQHSDIGYVNDMFLGGFIFIILQYGTIFLFLLKSNKSKIKGFNDPLGDLNFIISSVLILSLLLANYKGEVMRSGLILLAAIAIKLIIIEPETEDEL